MPYQDTNLDTNTVSNNFLSSNFCSTKQKSELNINETLATPKSVLKKITPNENFEKEFSSECSICMNNKVNSVIYRCGHMCMCYECAKETQRRSGDCPICRTQIIDVIRCYPS